MDTRFRSGRRGLPPPLTPKDANDSSGKSLVLRLVFILAGFLLVHYGVLFAMKYKAAAESADWPHVDGTIIESRAGVGSFMVQPHIKYTYAVDGQIFTGHKITYGPSPGTGTIEAGEQASEYPVGTRVSVFHDPGDPSIAVLVPGAFGEYGWPPRVFVFSILLGIALLLSEAVRWRNGPSWLVLSAVCAIAIAIFNAEPLLSCYTYYRSRHLDAKESERWPTTPGAAPAWIGVNWEWDFSSIPSERGICYEYVVDGTLYRNTQVEFGVDWTRYDGSKILRRIQFMTGRNGRVTVSYDPANPARSVLQPGAHAFPLADFDANSAFMYLGFAAAIGSLGGIIFLQFARVRVSP